MMPHPPVGTGWGFGDIPTGGERVGIYHQVTTGGWGTMNLNHTFKFMVPHPLWGQGGDLVINPHPVPTGGDYHQIPNPSPQGGGAI